MNKFINALGKSILTLLVILLIGYGWAFFEMKIMLKSYPELLGYLFYQVETEDMFPDFNEDDVVIVKKNADYITGERVLYLTENSEYKLGTVVHTDSLSTTTKCDTCSQNNAPIDNSTVIGKAVGKVSAFGKFINFFRQKWFLTSLAVLGFIFIVASQYIHETPKQVV